MTMRKCLAMGLAFGLLFVTGCSSKAATSSTGKSGSGSTVTSTSAEIAATTTTISTSTLAAEFNSDANTVLAVSSQVKSAVGNLPSTATGSQILAAAQPLVAAGQTYETQITDLPWPPADNSDAHALVSAVAAYIGALQSVTNQSALSISSWETQVESLQSAEKASADVLRHDIGLPPEQSS
ncbi:MAG: hypothetical protein ACLQPH_18715 [Acidimicrobiales bacterium]